MFWLHGFDFWNKAISLVFKMSMVFAFTTAFVRRLLLCLRGRSSFSTSSSQKQKNPAFICFLMLLIADKRGLQHLEMIPQPVLQKQSTQRKPIRYVQKKQNKTQKEN